MALPKNFQYEESGTSRYTMSQLKSTNKVKFRIVSDFIDGKSVWGDSPDGKRVPTRRRSGEPIPTKAIGVNKFSGKPEQIKQFIAAVVWNYKTEQLEIFETDKPTIIGQIVAIEANEDWGDSKNYDLTITKSGEGMDTEYHVLPSNKASFKSPDDPKSVNLEALFTNDDPFSESNQEKDYRGGDISEDVANDVPF